jgi:YfiH family protein
MRRETIQKRPPIPLPKTESDTTFKDMITVPGFQKDVRGVIHAFGTRSSSEKGALHVGTGLDPVTVKQVHGTDILFIPQGMGRAEIDSTAGVQGYDAIVTNRPRTWVAVRTADCVPILLMDPARRAVAAVHAGWRGTLARITPKVVQLMREALGCDVTALRAVIGPSIGRCCYEVDEVVLAPLKRGCSYWAEVVTEKKTARGQLDLSLLNYRQLEETGLEASRITVVNLCTSCHPSLFHSYRRDGSGTGHMASGIALL